MAPPRIASRTALPDGDRLRVLATDQGSVRDFRVFCEQSGHRLLASEDGRVWFRSYQASDDMDGDGVNNPVDAFPEDVAASVDADFDGAPGDWNTGFSEQDSTTGSARAHR